MVIIIVGMAIALQEYQEEKENKKTLQSHITPIYLL